MTAEVREILAWLEKRGSKKNREGMARYGIVADKVYGVSVATIRAKGKDLGRDHKLAIGLWDTGWYEARMLAAFVDDPGQVTPSQMDSWAKDFDNWAICDTLCFHLFDRTPHAWTKVDQWSERREEFVKRAGFALVAGVALHDKKAEDALFLRSLALIERASDDERNFVKKGVSWALRSIGHRNAALHVAAMETADKLSKAPGRVAKWIGKDALRDLSREMVRDRVAKRVSSRAPTS